MFQQIPRDDIEFLRGTTVYRKVYYEFGANVTFDKVSILGWSKSGKTVKVLDVVEDRSLFVRPENLFEKSLDEKSNTT